MSQEKATGATAPANPFKDDGPNWEIIPARTTEQMVAARLRNPPIGSLRVYECGKDFCGECSCCVACYPFCCEGGCYP